MQPVLPALPLIVPHSAHPVQRSESPPPMSVRGSADPLGYKGQVFQRHIHDVFNFSQEQQRKSSPPPPLSHSTDKKSQKMDKKTQVLQLKRKKTAQLSVE